MKLEPKIHFSGTLKLGLNIVKTSPLQQFCRVQSITVFGKSVDADFNNIQIETCDDLELEPEFAKKLICLIGQRIVLPLKNLKNEPIRVRGFLTVTWPPDEDEYVGPELLTLPGHVAYPTQEIECK